MRARCSTRLTGTVVATVTVLLAMTLPSAAFGSVQDTWVASTGSDSNACTFAAPCATFQHAIGDTTAGGEVNVEDDGNYGGIVINNSITIDGDGHDAAVGPGVAQEVAVNELSTSDAVNLIDLDLDGYGSAVEGVYYPGGGSLRIEDSKIYGFTYDGVIENTSGRLEIDDSSISGNGEYGIYDNPDGGQVVIDDSQIDQNGGSGVYDNLGYSTQPTEIEIDGSTIDQNQQDGVIDLPASLGTVTSQVTLQNDEIDQNACGVVAETMSAAATFSAGNCGAGTTAVPGTAATISSFNTTISNNVGSGVLSSGAAAQNMLTSDLVTGNGTGLSEANGGTIVSVGAGNSVYANTTAGSATSSVATGAVGTAGATGPSGAAGSQGAAGKQGAAGEIELVTCKQVTKTEKVHGKKKKVQKQSCTGKRVSGSFKLTTKALLRLKDHAGKGRYTLTLWRGSRVISRTVLSVR